MNKIKNQLLILLAAAIVAGSGLPYNPNNLGDSGENPIGASDSVTIEDNGQDNDGKNTVADKQDCDKEEDKLTD